MRRSEKAVTDKADRELILTRGRICQLAIQAEPVPYLVSLNYGHHDGALYFHSAPEGRKIELLRRNPRVAFTIVVDGGVIGASQGCSWTNRFQSVVGYGTIMFLEHPADKRFGLDRIMAHYSEDHYAYPDTVVARTLVYKLEIEEMTGKQSRMDL